VDGISEKAVLRDFSVVEQPLANTPSFGRRRKEKLVDLMRQPKATVAID
jgi:hypothetical protein